jgi:hypothetical protein
VSEASTILHAVSSISVTVACVERDKYVDEFLLEGSTLERASFSFWDLKDCCPFSRLEEEWWLWIINLLLFPCQQMWLLVKSGLLFYPSSFVSADDLAFRTALAFGCSSSLVPMSVLSLSTPGL